MPMSRWDVLDQIEAYFDDPRHDLAAYEAEEDGVTRCIYRGFNEDGKHDPSSTKRCAVGCLIPDDMYRDTFETKGVVGIWDNIKSLFNDDVQASFLGLIQAKHDHWADDNDKESFLRDLRTIRDTLEVV